LRRRFHAEQLRDRDEGVGKRDELVGRGGEVYEKSGCEREVFEEIGIPHVKMRKGISDARSVQNSPKRV